MDPQRLRRLSLERLVFAALVFGCVGGATYDARSTSHAFVAALFLDVFTVQNCAGDGGLCNVAFERVNGDKHDVSWWVVCPQTPTPTRFFNRETGLLQISPLIGARCTAA
mgnify:CR=1 FL=1